MTLRDRIARILCASCPANTEGSAFEDYAEPSQREWLAQADAILADPEIAAAIKMADTLRSIRDNYDCDEDAHRYGTPCRCCIARETLAVYDAAKGDK